MTLPLNCKTIRVEIEPGTIYPDRIDISILIDSVWSILNRAQELQKMAVFVSLLHLLKFLHHQKIHLGVSYSPGLGVCLEMQHER